MCLAIWKRKEKNIPPSPLPTPQIKPIEPNPRCTTTTGDRKKTHRTMFTEPLSATLRMYVCSLNKFPILEMEPFWRYRDERGSANPSSSPTGLLAPRQKKKTTHGNARAPKKFDKSPNSISFVPGGIKVLKVQKPACRITNGWVVEGWSGYL